MSTPSEMTRAAKLFDERTAPSEEIQRGTDREELFRVKATQPGAQVVRTSLDKHMDHGENLFAHFTRADVGN